MVVVDYLKNAVSWVLAQVDFALGPWMRDPVKSMPLFNALVGYAFMLTVGCVSKGLMVKLITWAVLLAWNVVRTFKLSDVVHPVDAAKAKLPPMISYHIGAAVGFLLTNV